MVRYTSQLGLVHGIGEIFVGIGTLMITMASTLIGYLLLTRTSLNEKILSPFGPTCAFLLISYVIGHNFMSIYGMSADTIVHCYCMDDEIHEKSGGPQHAPPLLRKFIDNHNSEKGMKQPLSS